MREDRQSQRLWNTYGCVTCAALEGILLLANPVAGLATLAVMGAVLGTGWAEAANTSGWVSLEQLRGPARRLCPHCLRFEHFAVVCASCGERELLYLARVDPNRCGFRSYVCCLKCGVFPLTPGKKVAVAQCGGCGHNSPTDLRGEPLVRVIGALTPADFDWLCRTGSVSPDGEAGIRRAWQPAGQLLTCVLDLSTLPSRTTPLPPHHVLHSLNALWLWDGPTDLLGLGEVSDRLLRCLGKAEKGARGLPVWTNARSLAPAVHDILVSRFGKLEHHIPPADALDLVWTTGPVW